MLLREALEKIATFHPHDHGFFAESVRHIANETLSQPPASSPLEGEVLQGAIFEEVVRNNCWSLRLIFGEGDDARDRMRLASDVLRTPFSASAAEGVRKAAIDAVEELANTRMDLPLDRWGELSSIILAALSTEAGEVTKDVRALVIAAREAWEESCVSGDALDKALEPFSALVPYENEPDAVDDPKPDARLHDDPKLLRAAMEIWFSRDLSETQRRQFINICGMPGVEANSHGLQMRCLRYVLAAIAEAGKPAPLTELQALGQEFEKAMEPLGAEMEAIWQPIDTAPRDGTPFIAALWVKHTNGRSWQETHVVWCDDETGEIDSACDQGWSRVDDYVAWMPIPDLPPIEESR